MNLDFELTDTELGMFIQYGTEANERASLYFKTTKEWELDGHSRIVVCAKLYTTPPGDILFTARYYGINAGSTTPRHISDHGRWTTTEWFSKERHAYDLIEISYDDAVHEMKLLQLQNL